jgi:LysM repeat protein/ABC-type branched-subunit amino acid transport system substrate-binding protein
MNLKGKIYIVYFLLAALLVSCATRKKQPESKQKKPKKVEAASDSPYFMYRVPKNQSLSSVAQQFKVTVQQIKALNPGLEDSLKVGQQIKIPAAETVEAPEPAEKEKFNIALLLPFNLGFDDDTSEAEEISDRTSRKAALGFYEGALIALDSLEKEGFRCNVYVHDADNDTLKIRNLLQRPEMKTMSLIIGPFSNVYLKPVTGFGRSAGIPVVSPLSSTQAPFTDNPYVAVAVPPVGTQCRKMAEYIAENYKHDNLLVIHQPGKDDQLSSIFRNILQRAGLSVRDVPQPKINSKTLLSELSSTQKNVVIIPSSNEAFVIEALNILNGRRDRNSIIVIGLPTWDNFESVDIDIIQNLNTIIFKTVHPRRQEEGTRAFIRKYTGLYKTEPGIYAFQGFGIMYYYGKLMQQHGKKFWNELPNFKQQVLHTDYRYKKNGNGAYENQFINILLYKDFELLRLNR